MQGLNDQGPFSTANHDCEDNSKVDKGHQNCNKKCTFSVWVENQIGPGHALLAMVLLDIGSAESTVDPTQKWNHMSYFINSADTLPLPS